MMPVRRVLLKFRHDKDSLVQVFDSVGNAYYQDARQVLYPVLQLKKSDLVKAKTLASTKNFDLDTLYNKMNT